MTKQTSISIHSVIIQWLHWLCGTYYIHHYMQNVNYLYMFLITVVTCRCRFMFGQHYVQCIWLMWHLIFITPQVPEMLFGFTFKIFILFNLFPLIPACTACPGLPLLPASTARPGLPLSAPVNGLNDDRHRQSPSHHSLWISHLHIKRWCWFEAASDNDHK